MYWKSILILISIKIKMLNPPSHLPIDVYQKLLPIFLDEINADFKLLKNNHVANNWQEVKRLSHKINGSASSYGAIEVQKEAAIIENSDEKNIDLNRKAVSRMEIAIEKLNKYIQKEFKQLNS